MVSLVHVQHSLGVVCVEAIVEKENDLPVIKISYTYPCKEDVESIFEVDACSWAEAMEKGDRK